jgi:Domain of unknown function (DUF4333)
VPRRRAAAGVAACLSLVMLAGCGDRTLDTSRLETQIGKTLSDRTGFRITTVDCPNDVKAKKGGRFTCTVTTSRNERVAVNVVQDDDQGGVTWKLAGPLKR